jgi:hypothetical protein
MSLAWLAAVLLPGDIAIHPNFPSDEYALLPEAQLGAVVLGRWQQLVNYQGGRQSTDHLDPAIQTAMNALTQGAAAEARTHLEEIIRAERDDAARTAALALIVCISAAGADDYVTCQRVLDYELSALDYASSESRNEDRLLAAVLLQQKCIRMADAGSEYASIAQESLALLSGIDPGRCRPFDLSESVSWTSTKTITDIVEVLTDAALSFLPEDPVFADTSSHLLEQQEPIWIRRIRTPIPRRLLTIGVSSESVYERFIKNIYRETLHSTSRSLFSTASQDTFFELVGLELLGHGSVRAAREQLAMQRIIANAQFLPQSGDALSLLRHSGAKDSLELAVRSFRLGGPLRALSEDAAQIARRIAQGGALRSVELIVLEASAELMTAPVAEEMLREILTADGEFLTPVDLPMHREYTLSRRGHAYSAAAALAIPAEMNDEVGRAFLQELTLLPLEITADHKLARPLNDLDWSAMSTELRADWATWMNSGERREFTTVRDVVRDRLNLSSETTKVDLESVAHQIDLLRRSEGSVDDIPSLSAEVVRGDLARIRDDAVRGSYSFGELTAADVAIALVIYARDESLWDDVSKFLVDSRVSRNDRTPAFERLSREVPSLPNAVRKRFQSQAEQVVLAPPAFSEDEVTPYPAALRAFGCLGVLDEARVFEFTARLAGAESAEARREAATTVAALARANEGPWLLPLALQLSHEAHWDTSARAGRALVLLSTSAHREAAPAEKRAATSRILELLESDGILAPLIMLQAIDSLSEFPERIRESVQRLAVEHPALSVRRAARRLR